MENRELRLLIRKGYEDALKKGCKRCANLRGMFNLIKRLNLFGYSDNDYIKLITKCYLDIDKICKLAEKEEISEKVLQNLGKLVIW